MGNPADVQYGGRVLKTFDYTHELGSAPWLAIPHQGKYVYQTAAECKDQCARPPACRYGTYIHSGECWLSAHAHAPRQQPPCPSACSSFGVPRLI